MAMKKELRPIHDDVSCDICGRTILKGERTEPYLAPGGQRHIVCELCTDRAYSEGWIRESAHGEVPTAGRRPEARRSWFGRLLGRGGPPASRGSNGGPGEGQLASPAAADDAAASQPVEHHEPQRAGGYVPRLTRPKDPRHVRAVPTNAQVKVERALDLFNASSHSRTIAGIARSLGEPWVSSRPAPETPGEVVIVVAWELSWYRYRVDLGDADDPVGLLDKGEELRELDVNDRDWNAAADSEGRLSVGVRASS